tara:strand:- start:612 stop:827 length:216 start_codon:yes stop_codon:yes gene_type:complete
MNKKTLELLLLRYNEMHTAILKPCAEKEKFAKLIEETALALTKCKPEITYKDGMTALEFAINLAAERNNNV